MTEKLLLDVTSIITYISDICRDPNIQQRYENWESRSKLISEQIKNESEDPIFPKLQKVFENKTLCTTMSAWDKARSLIENFGSDLENKNLKSLSEEISLLEDDPSERIRKLNRKYWSKLNKSVFGTADKLNMKVVTGNVNVISSLINDHDINLEYIAHRSRCFVGKKHQL